MSPLVILLAVAAVAAGPASTDAATAAPAAISAPAAVRREAAQALLAQMDARREAVLRRFGEARAERDVLRMNYIGAKAAAIAGLLRIARDAARALDAALARGELVAARHAEEKMALAGEKVQRLAAQSANAIGDATVFAGATELKVSYDAALAGPEVQPVEQMFELWHKDAALAARPPAASPYQ